MKTGRDVPYLRLVESPDEAVDVSKVMRKKYKLTKGAEQLALPYLDPYTIVLANVAEISPGQFANMITGISPKWVIDTRIAPRFDQIARSRQHAFFLFHSLDANYIDLFGQLGLPSYQTANANPEFWGQAIFSMIKDALVNTSKPAGPFMFMFERTELIDAAKLALSEHFRQVFDESATPPMVECGKHSIAV